MFKQLVLLALFAVSCEAFVAPASPALSRSVVRATDVEMFGGSGKAAPKKAKKVVKKVVKKPVKKVVKKPVKKVVKKVVPKKSGAFRPGEQMPASQAVNELFGGIGNVLNVLKDLPKN